MVMVVSEARGSVDRKKNRPANEDVVAENNEAGVFELIEVAAE
jgi:hypothetical protein